MFFEYSARILAISLQDIIVLLEGYCQLDRMFLGKGRERLKTKTSEVLKTSEVWGNENCVVLK
jgi:hypothetical protein